jgi:hypothetical protein
MATFMISFWGKLVRRVFFLGLAGSLLADMAHHNDSAEKNLRHGLVSLASINRSLLPVTKHAKP